MVNHINIDDYSFLTADNVLYLFFPEQHEEVIEAKILYNTQNVLLLKRNQIYYVFKDIPVDIRELLNTIQTLTFVEMKGDNQTIARGYEVEITPNVNVPNIDNIETSFDSDFSFLKEYINDDEYNQFKIILGIK